MFRKLSAHGIMAHWHSRGMETAGFSLVARPPTRFRDPVTGSEAHREMVGAPRTGGVHWLAVGQAPMQLRKPRAHDTLSFL